MSEEKWWRGPRRLYPIKSLQFSFAFRTGSAIQRLNLEQKQSGYHKEIRKGVRKFTVRKQRPLEIRIKLCKVMSSLSDVWIQILSCHIGATKKMETMEIFSKFTNAFHYIIFLTLLDKNQTEYFWLHFLFWNSCMKYFRPYSRWS